MATSTKSYQQMNDKLAELMAWFESEQVDLDLAVAKYEETMELIKQMQRHLKTAENKVKKISAKFE